MDTDTASSADEARGSSARPFAESTTPASAVPRPAMRLAAIVSAALLAVVLLDVLASAPDRAVQGDEASFVYNAISIRGGNLSYDSADQERWLSLGMGDYPVGLFTQAYDGGWAAAKPIGYSVLLAPFLWAFGLRGTQVVGAVLLLAYASCWYGSVRLRWSRQASLIVAGVATLGSHVWFYAFSAHADLFVATLVGIVSYGCLRGALRADAVWMWSACGAAGVLATEKIPALLALLPVLGVAALRLGRRRAMTGAAILLGVGAMTTVPYLHYSDGASWSAYGGDRYYVGEARPPWDGGDVRDMQSVRTDEVITLGFVADRLSSPSGDIPHAALTYVLGRHTGALTFMPIAPLLIAAAVPVLRRARRARTGDVPPSGTIDRAAEIGIPGIEDTSETGDGVPSASGEHPMSFLAWAGLATMALYVGFYLLLFTNNYYGGYHSIGNRYFLQFSAVAVIPPIAAGLSQRVALLCAAAAAAWSVVVLGPLLLDGDNMFREFWHTTATQRLLPYDRTQDHAIGTWTGPPDRAVLEGPWRWTGSELATTGRTDGDTVRVLPGRDEPGFVTVGPYIEMASGRYRATVQYASSVPVDTSDAIFDIAVLGATVEVTDLPGTSSLVSEVSVEFDVTRSAGWEFRTVWYGAGDLEVRSIAVESVD
jgi:hypothetical protein